LTSLRPTDVIRIGRKAQLWINHDKPQRDSLKMAPAFYG